MIDLDKIKADQLAIEAKQLNVLNKYTRGSSTWAHSSRLEHQILCAMQSYADQTKAEVIEKVLGVINSHRTSDSKYIYDVNNLITQIKAL
ncbi:MAG: hypothetical protein ACHQF4_02465 [Sphingobacteriales bacterium]|jgi:hypothetical protein